MRQKFPMFTLVHVAKDLPRSMSHFKSDFYGVVGGTYSQKFGGKDIDKYSIYILKDNKVVSCSSWYHEDQLTAEPLQDRETAEIMIEDYNFRD